MPLADGAVVGGDEVPLRPWTTVKVVATTTTAQLYTDDAAGHDTLVGALPRQTPDPFDAVTGHAITSGSTVGAGTEVVLDDLSLT